jgi:hypothetical protein
VASVADKANRGSIAGEIMSQRTPTKAEINRYAESFVLYGDKTKAAKAAYPKTRARPKAINELGSNLYAMAKVRQRIEALQIKKHEIADKEFNINAKYVLGRLHEIDTLDILDIINDDFSAFKKLSEWPRSWRISISSIDLKRIISREGKDDIESLIQKVRWPDKTKNLEIMGKHVDVNAFKEDGQEPAADLAKALYEIAQNLPG